MNTLISPIDALLIAAKRLRLGKSHGSKNQQLAATCQQPSRHQQPALPVLIFLCCIGGTLATITGCAAERGTIGAQLGQRDDGRLFIRETPLGLAAQRAGLRPGDEITLINGQDVRSFDEKGIHRILEGEVGDPEKLTVLRGEQVLHVTLQRTPAPRPRKPGTKSE